MGSSTQNYYETLGVSPSASLKEIKAAYYRCVKQSHPDRFDPEQQSEDWTRANEALRLLNQAYDILSNAARRREYDRKMEAKNQENVKKPENSKQNRTEFANIHFEKAEAWLYNIPEPLRHTLKKRQRAEISPHIRIPIKEPGPNYWLGLLALGWLLFLPTELTRDGLWNNDLQMLYGIVTVAAAVAIGTQILRALRQHKQTLQNSYYITPFYVIRILNEKVSIWPLWKLDQCRLIHTRRGDFYAFSDIILGFGKEALRIVVHSKKQAESYAETILQFQVSAQRAITLGDSEFITCNDDLKGIALPTKAGRNPDIKRMATIYSLSVVFALVLFRASYEFNRHYPPNIHPTQDVWAKYPDYIPPNAPSGIDPWAKYPVVTDPKLIALLEQDTNVNAYKSRTPTLVEEALPANGFILHHSKAKPIAPFRVITHNGSHHFVKMVDWKTGKPVVEFFIRAGQSVDVDMPLGSYTMRYATGDTWYGQESLFGAETQYHTTNTRFDFYAHGNRVVGHTIELFLQVNGNLSTRAISSDQW